MSVLRVCAVTSDNRRTSNRLLKNQLQLDQGFDGEPISAAANATKTASTMCRMAVLISWRQLATFFIFFHVGPVSPQQHSQQHNSQEFLNELSEIKWLKHPTLLLEADRDKISRICALHGTPRCSLPKVGQCQWLGSPSVAPTLLAVSSMRQRQRGEGPLCQPQFEHV